MKDTGTPDPWFVPPLPDAPKPADAIKDNNQPVAEPKLSYEDFRQVWKLSKGLKRQLTWLRWFDFATGALTVSIVWFIIILAAKLLP